jgi:hypothetical protein
MWACMLYYYFKQVVVVVVVVVGRTEKGEGANRYYNTFIPVTTFCNSLHVPLLLLLLQY